MAGLYFMNAQSSKICNDDDNDINEDSGGLQFIVRLSDCDEILLYLPTLQSTASTVAFLHSGYNSLPYLRIRSVYTYVNHSRTCIRWNCELTGIRIKQFNKTQNHYLKWGLEFCLKFYYMKILYLFALHY